MMGSVKYNQICGICERNGKPEPAFVDIEWTDEVNPKTGKNKPLFFDAGTQVKHMHHENPNSTFKPRANNVEVLQQSEHLAAFYSRLADVERQVKELRSEAQTFK